MEVINRERWRRYAKGKMTKEELARLISDMANDISKDLINEKCYNTNVLFRAAILLHMHDKYGFGKKRLLTLLDELEKTLEAYEEGYISIDEWSENEIHTLFRLRQQGIDFSVIGRRIGRSTDACRVKHNTMQNIYPNIKTRERAPRKYSRPQYSMCWICAKVCNGCKKPVKGWKATKVVNHEGEAYIVKQCPEYEPEPWADKYDCSEFYQNPKKAVKNGKASRSET